MPLRQTAGFIESLIRLVGLDWAVPDFSTLKWSPLFGQLSSVSKVYWV